MRDLRIKTVLRNLQSQVLCNLKPLFQWTTIWQRVIEHSRKKFRLFVSSPVLGIGTSLALVFIFSGIAISATKQAKHDVDRLVVAMAYLDEIHQVNKLIDKLDLLEQRFKFWGDNHDLEQAESLRGQLHSSIWQLLDQPLAWASPDRIHHFSSANHFLVHEFSSQSSKYLETQNFEKLTLSNHRDNLFALSERVKRSVHPQLNQPNSQQVHPFLESALLPVVAGSFIVLLGLNLRSNKTLALRADKTQTSIDKAAFSPDSSLIEEAARASERAIIARDIHDELGALLMAVKIDIKRLSKTSANADNAKDARWSAILERVDTAMYTVTRIAENLKSQQVDHAGFWLAFENYIKDYQLAMDIPCSLRFDMVESSLIPQSSADDIFHIFQEALTNVARHARASNVEIEVRGNDDQLEIKIADNGTGISPAHILHPRSAGISGMFERAKRHGCDLTLSRQLTGGTMVQIRIPLQRS
jgi:signal transduction histidine kinase